MSRRTSTPGPNSAWPCGSNERAVEEVTLPLVKELARAYEMLDALESDPQQILDTAKQLVTVACLLVADAHAIERTRRSAS